MSILDSDDDVERRKYIISFFQQLIVSRCSKSGHVLLNLGHGLLNTRPYMSHLRGQN